MSNQLEKKLKELEKNEEFMHSAKLVAEIIRQDGGIIPTPRQLDKDPDLNMKRLREIVGTKFVGRLWDLLVKEARKQLPRDAEVVTTKKAANPAKVDSSEGLKERQREEWLERLVGIVEERNGTFPPFEILAMQLGSKYSELLEFFKSYDGAKAATMIAYKKKHPKVAEKPKTSEEPKIVEKPRAELLKPSAKEREEAPELKTTGKDKKGRKGYYTTEKCKEILREYHKKHGRFPSQSECRKDPNLPCWSTLILYAGSHRDWAEKVRIEAEPEPVKLELAKSESEPVEAELETKRRLSGVPTGEKPKKPEAKADVIVNSEESEAVLVERKIGDGLEVQVIVKLPGQEKPLKITISQ